MSITRRTAETVARRKGGELAAGRLRNTGTAAQSNNHTATTTHSPTTQRQPHSPPLVNHCRHADTQTRRHAATPRNRTQKNNDHPATTSTIATVENYLDRSDGSERQRANQGIRWASLIHHSAGKIVANYWLERLHSGDWRAAPRKGDYITTSTCSRLLRRLVPQAPHQGFNGVGGAIASAPPPFLVGLRPDRQLPRHPPERVGGCPRRSPPSTPTWRPSCAWTMEYEEIVQCILLHLQPERAFALGQPVPLHEPDLRLDVPGRPGRQASSSATRSSTSYGELRREMDLINRAFIES